jgi:Flp pilus assembly protein protease CpaA
MCDRSIPFSVGGVSDMNMMNTGRLHAPGRTTERVVAAWRSGGRSVRLAAAGAWITSATAAYAVVRAPDDPFAFAATGVVLATAAMVDVAEEKLPNALLALAAVVSFAGTLPAWHRNAPSGALVGAALGFLLFGIVWLVRGVGMGDVKMATVVGLSVGSLSPLATPIAIAVGAFTASLCGLLAGRNRMVLGPSLWLGWMVAVVTSNWRW